MKALVNKMTKNIALALCLLAHLSVFAIHEEVEVSNIGLGLTSTINIESSRKGAIDAAPGTWFLNFGVASLSNDIIFGIDQDIHQIDDKYRYSLYRYQQHQSVYYWSDSSESYPKLCCLRQHLNPG